MNERLVNLLLLAIIDAHDPATQTASREQRLAQAKEALFGIKQSAGREPLDDDEALLEMYRIQLRQFAPTIAHAMKGAYARMHGEAFDEPPPPEPSPKSMRQIAREAADKAALHRGHAPTDKGLEDRLRLKFRKKTLTVNDAIELEEILDGTLTELETIAQILELLEELGVKTKAEMGRKGTD